MTYLWDPEYVTAGQTGQWRPATFPLEVVTTPADSAGVDAFSRIRTSNPVTVFDSTFQYGLAPLLYEVLSTNTGTVTHDPTNACAVLACSAGGAGSATLQSYRYIRYQPGKSQLVFLTFTLGAAVANVTRQIGLWDDANGFYLEQAGTTVNLVRKSASGTGSLTVPQSSWNLNKMDGTGKGGILLDLSKSQILIIDAQWLGVGRVRIGFDIDGKIYYVHEFLHANYTNNVYTQTLNLPIRARISTSAAVAANMKMICASVQSEGGSESEIGYNFASQSAGATGNGTRTHILSLQPATGFNGQVNRTTFVLEEIDVLNTSSTPMYWELCVGTDVGGTFTSDNTGYSAIQTNRGGTLTGNPGIVFANGYLQATVQNKSSVSQNLSIKYPITLNASGSPRSFGRISLLASGIGGAATLQAALTWKEIR
jgi:hypothetical protein